MGSLRLVEVVSSALAPYLGFLFLLHLPLIRPIERVNSDLAPARRKTPSAFS